MISRWKTVVIGFYADGSPIYLPMGGDDNDFDSNMGEDGNEGEDEEDEDEEDEEDEEDGGDGDQQKKGDSKGKVEDKKSAQGDEVAELRRRLAKTRSESARRRKRIAALEAEATASKDTSEEAKNAREAEQRGFTTAESKYKPQLISLAGRNALLSAGVPAEKVKRALRLIDMDDVEIDEDGDVVGIEDAIDELKDEWPELFAAKAGSDEGGEKRARSSAPKVKSSDVNGAGRKGSGQKKLSADEEIYRRLTGITPS